MYDVSPCSCREFLELNILHADGEAAPSSNRKYYNSNDDQELYDMCIR